MEEILGRHGQERAGVRLIVNTRSGQYNVVCFYTIGIQSCQNQETQFDDNSEHYWEI